MFISISSGTKEVQTQALGPLDCPVCQKEQLHSIVMHYHMSAVYGIFGTINSKQYLQLCDVCRYGAQLDTNEVEQKYGKHKFPLMEEHGVPVLAAGVLVLGAIVLGIALVAEWIEKQMKA